jgi:hypothetical protein
MREFSQQLPLSINVSSLYPLASRLDFLIHFEIEGRLP